MCDGTDMSFESSDIADCDADVSSAEIEEPNDFDFDEDFSNESEELENEAEFDETSFDEQDFSEDAEGDISQTFLESDESEADMCDVSDFDEEIFDDEDERDLNERFLDSPDSLEHEELVSAMDFDETSVDNQDFNEDLRNEETSFDFDEIYADELSKNGENEKIFAEEFETEDADDPPKVLKRDEDDLRRSGEQAIEKRLEAKEDDYRDKGFSEEEIAARLKTDRKEYQKEFSDDLFNGSSESADTSESEVSALEVKEAYSDDVSDTLDAEDTYSDDASDALEIDENDPEHMDFFPSTDSEENPSEVERSEEIAEAEDLYRARKSEGAEQTEDETDWDRTALSRENEAIVRDMNDREEIDIPETNLDWKAPKETASHLPTSESGEFNGERGNSFFYPQDSDVLSDMARFGQDHVEYINNSPDFSPFAVHDTPWGEADSTVEIGHMTDQRKNPGMEGFRRPRGSSHDIRYSLGNFSQADNALAESIKAQYPDSDVTPELIEKYRTDQKLVWHECADGKTMQLVPEKIHNACRHSGGVSVEKRNMAYGDITAPVDN